MTRLDKTLSQLREEYSPDADAKRRIHAALTAALPRAQDVPAEPPLGEQAAAAKAGGTMVGAKVAALLGAGAAIAFGVLQLSSPDRMSRAVVEPPSPPPAALVEEDGATPDAPGDAPSAAVGLEPTSDAPNRSQRIAVEPEELPSEKRKRVTSEQPTSEQPTSDAVAEQPTAAAATPAPTRLLEELRLVKSASQALNAGQTELARSNLAEHQRRFPTGQLSSERRALTLLLNCQGTPSRATRDAAARFIAKQPTSPLAQKLRKACTE